MNFRTDGAWAWPGAVAYYLREHGVPPDPDLVAHIRARRFTAPSEVPEPAKDLALAAITGESSTDGPLGLAVRAVSPLRHVHCTRLDELEFVADRTIKQAIATQAPAALILSPLLTGGQVFDK